MRFPNTVSLNTFKSYINLKKCKSTKNKSLNAFDFDWDVKDPELLVTLSIQSISDNWLAQPIFKEIESKEDQNFLLDILDVNYPLSEICSRIWDHEFWRRSYQNKWTICPGNFEKKPWIKIFLERYCSETIEMMKPNDYNQENMLNFIELCSPHVESIKINQLQPSLEEGNNDHIPFDIILPNLNELRKLDLSYDVKNIDTHFYLGCSNISANDIKNLVKGLEKCYELREFRLSCTKLEPFMLKSIGLALEKGSPNLQSIHLPHCRAGDVGLCAFLDTLNQDSFPHLTDICLTNNFISAEGVVELVKSIKFRKIEKLNLRLNPITSDGIAVIFYAMKFMPLKELDIACCSIDDTLQPLLVELFRSNTTLKSLDLSTNKLGNELGEHIFNTLLKNSSLTLKKLDVRNTGISNDIKFCIDAIILGNRHKK